MHSVLATILILFAGWTLASHVSVLAGRSLHALGWIAPFFMGGLAIAYLAVLKRTPAQHPPAESLDPPHAGSGYDSPPLAMLLPVCLTPLLLRFSWTAFWLASMVILACCVYRKIPGGAQWPCAVESTAPREWLAVLGLAAAAAILTLAVSRSDLDDAFYVAVAAFASAHPADALLGRDAMHGDPNLPLLFPSYRFSSFELLAAGLASWAGRPAMDIVYIVLPPLWAAVTVFSVFLLSRELMPQRWLLLGVLSLALIVVLGETHRAPANMMFVRMFQGKAVYLAAILPAIFYLIMRYLSPRGTRADLFLLGCALVTAIGLSNFAMLAAPVSAMVALLSHAALVYRDSRRKVLGAMAVMAIPLPYLLMVALQSGGGLPPQPLFPDEAPSAVWLSVFGPHQQYLIAFLLLAGPVFARDGLMRQRLAIPPLLLLAVFLNPLFSDFIARHITTPLAYWRVTWAYPVLIFSAASVCVLLDRFRENRRAWLSAIMLTIAAGLLVLSLPYHTLRPGNMGVRFELAARKIPPDHQAVAQRAIQIGAPGGRMLAPDEIAGVISRFEQRPPLVSVRNHYLDLLAPALGETDYRQRRTLYAFVTGAPVGDPATPRAALRSLKVATIVMREDGESEAKVQLLQAERYRRLETLHGYAIWSLSP